MAKAGRLYLRLDVDYYDNPKVIAAGERAEVLYVRAMAKSKQLLSDGILVDTHLDRLGLPGWKARADQLVKVGLWEKVAGGYRIVGYLERNPSAKQVGDAADAKREASLLGNHNRWHEAAGKVDPKCPLCRPPDPPATTEPILDGIADGIAGGNPKPSQVGVAVGVAQRIHRDRDRDRDRVISDAIPVAIPAPTPSSPGQDRNEDALCQRWITGMALGSQAKPAHHQLTRLVIERARQVLDDRIIDQIIGKCQEGRMPKSAHYLLSACHDWATSNLPGADLSALEIPAHLDPTRTAYAHAVPNTTRGDAA